MGHYGTLFKNMGFMGRVEGLQPLRAQSCRQGCFHPSVGWLAKPHTGRSQPVPCLRRFGQVGATQAALAPAPGTTSSTPSWMRAGSPSSSPARPPAAAGRALPRPGSLVGGVKGCPAVAEAAAPVTLASTALAPLPPWE